MKLLRKISTGVGGGIAPLVITLAIFAILTNLHSKELSEICKNGTCNITDPQDTITNSAPFSITNGIEIKTQIQTFINRSTIKATKINVDSNSNYIANFYNYGRIETTDAQGSLQTNSVSDSGYGNIYNYGYISGYIYLAKNETGTTNIVNYGEMGGLVQRDNASKDITIDNRGTINLFNENSKYKHFKNIKLLTLKNYAMRISKGASVFNAFSGNATDNSHLVLDNVQSVNFADKDSKMILDFGSGFEFGKGYLLSKLVVDTSGTNQLGVDFSRLVPRSDIYSISQSGEYFIATLNTKASTIGNLYKANIRTMNNFYTISNSMIYPHKYSAKRAQNKRRVIRRVKRTANVVDDSSLRDSALAESWQSTLQSLALNESFAYKSDSNNLSDLSDSTTYTNQNSINHIRIANIDETNQRTNRNRISTNRQAKSTIPSAQATKTDKYYFILTPFVNHNLFFESGRYNLSGLEYGFLTAFSGKLTPSNTLGTHFIMSYGSLGDNDTNQSKGDKEFNIKSLNLNIGLNYKLDLIFDMYLKARGDFYYFLNQVKTLTLFEAIKPNNLGFGLSLSYGKDFDFKDNGILGIEVGLDYKGLQSNEVNINNNATNSISETYQKNLYNLIYVDLGLNYNKYFNTNIGLWGINTTLGIKGNITANKLSKSQIHINNLNRDVNMVLDNDKILAYANISASYVLNHKDFDMEFSLAYYGNYGDRVISNGGGVEWRVMF